MKRENRSSKFEFDTRSIFFGGGRSFLFLYHRNYGCSFTIKIQTCVSNMTMKKDNSKNPIFAPLFKLHNPPFPCTHLSTWQFQEITNSQRKQEEKESRQVGKEQEIKVATISFSPLRPRFPLYWWIVVLRPFLSLFFGQMRVVFSHPKCLGESFLWSSRECKCVFQTTHCHTKSGRNRANFKFSKP